MDLFAKENPACAHVSFIDRHERDTSFHVHHDRAGISGVSHSCDLTARWQKRVLARNDVMRAERNAVVAAWVVLGRLPGYGLDSIEPKR